MTLFEQWEALIDSQNKSTFKEFWEKYSSTEKKIYQGILADYKTKPAGTFKELAAKYDADPVIFMGFLDGIDPSLKESIDFKNFDENSEMILDIDFEKLYFNMHDASADYLYSLEEWKNILTEEKRHEIIKSYKKSKTVVKDKLPGRNDPCPCGSGKKYKKCCGK